jgi:16S rRNA processing protein RimM
VSGWDDFVLVGRVARTHGRRGEVIVNPETDFPDERFVPGAAVWILRDGVPVSVTIRSAWTHKGRPVIALEGVETMTGAEGLHGVELRVPPEALHALPAGSYYEHDLVGCTLTTEDGQLLGVVRAVERGSGAPRLIVGHGRDEFQMPLVDAFCVDIDVAARRIVVRPPEGLIGLNG